MGRGSVLERDTAKIAHRAGDDHTGKDLVKEERVGDLACRGKIFVCLQVSLPGLWTFTRPYYYAARRVDHYAAVLVANPYVEMFGWSLVLPGERRENASAAVVINVLINTAGGESRGKGFRTSPSYTLSSIIS